MMSGQIEIAVVGQIADGVLITNRVVGNRQIGSIQGIGDKDMEGSGISLFPV